MTVYFARVKEDGPVKIGFTDADPFERIAKLQGACPWPIALLGSIEGSVSTERAIHLHLSEHRMLGEWFQPHADVLNVIERLLGGAGVETILQHHGLTAVGKVIARAIHVAGSEAQLAQRIGYTQVAINKAKNRGYCSAEMAAKIHAALAPDVTMSDLRPDLFKPAEAA